MSNLTSASGEASASSGNRTEIGSDYSQQYFASPPTQTQAPTKKKRNLPGNPDPEAEVVALSPKTLLATNRFVCEICNKGFQRDQNLQLHRRGHNLPWKLKQRTGKEIRKKVYVCPEASCVHHDPSRALGDLTGIKKHFCRKHGEKKWKCDKCSKKYAVQSDWKAHSKTCGTREYRCDCGTLFSRRDSFITHRAFCDALAEESARSVTGMDIGIGIPSNSATTPTTPHKAPSAGVVIPSSSHHHHHHHHHHEDIHGSNFPLKKEQQGFIPPWLGQPPSTIDLSSSSSFFSQQDHVSNLHENPNPRGGGGGGGPTLPPYPTAPSPPHMSATALLQKAAQMGATMSKTGSMIRTHQQAHVSFVLPFQFRAFHFNREEIMKLKTYAGLSFIATLAIIYHAFNSRGQFYPAMVYLSTSKISLVLLLNMGLVFMCILWQLTKKIFLGSLREAEVERLNEQSWREVMEILFAITIFRQDFSVTFLAMVTALLLIKALHWLAQKRVEYIETTPSVPMLSHVRIVSFMGFLLLLDSLFLYSSLKHLIETWQASVSLFFCFEYMILATTTVSIFVKYIFYVSDMLMEGQWEKKPVFTFYLELIRDLLHLSMYMCFFLVIFVNYGIPLHLIRELYETFRNFKVRVADYIRYRKITSNMNDRFPDATPEELTASDATCIICREEMTTAKKLICGHLFHVHCLRSWLERQHTCPTCRALVVPPENGTTGAVGPQGSQADGQRQGAGTGGESTAQNEATDNLSRHQARLQAAAAAASIYEKSYVYPSANSFVCSPGYTLHPPVAESTNKDSSGGQTSREQTQSWFLTTGAPTNESYPPMQHFHLLPSQPYAALVNYGKGFENDPNIPSSHLEAYRKLLQCQIQILQNQLEILQKTRSDRSVDEGTSSSDSRGKSVISSSESGRAYTEEIQDGKA